MTQLKVQLNLFWIALAFLTRVPVPARVDYSQQNLNQASRYFSLIGWLVGGICAAVYCGLNLVFPDTAAILFMMLFGLLLTGCFHEDGLADTCDGLGGGFEKSRKLAIMKDSRLGTYGAAGLWMALTLKFILLIELSKVSEVWLALIVAHPLSRAASTSLIVLLPYVSDAENAKVKPLAEKQGSYDLPINLAIGLIALLLVSQQALMLVIGIGISLGFIRQYLLKQIGGFTGDTLGATQQIIELLIYALLVAGGYNA